jgi:hypothetical protein
MEKFLGPVSLVENLGGYKILSSQYLKGSGNEEAFPLSNIDRIESYLRLSWFLSPSISPILINESSLQEGRISGMTTEIRWKIHCFEFYIGFRNEICNFGTLTVLINPK